MTKSITRLIKNVVVAQPMSVAGVGNKSVAKLDEVLRRLFTGIRTGL
ncbi:MAG: hypothetical protein ACRCYA_04080 [Cetobacterium sp.]